jgi:hypothetical protein
MLQRKMEGGDATRVERPAPAPSEPATARALWPTFMRRTLSEEALRAPPEPPPAR